MTDTSYSAQAIRKEAIASLSLDEIVQASQERRKQINREGGIRSNKYIPQDNEMEYNDKYNSPSAGELLERPAREPGIIIMHNKI